MMTEIFIDDDGDLVLDGRDDDGEMFEGVTRYIRDDLCVELNSAVTVLRHVPLFNCHTDPEGNVWVKIPVKVNHE